MEWRPAPAPPPPRPRPARPAPAFPAPACPAPALCLRESSRRLTAGPREEGPASALVSLQAALARQSTSLDSQKHIDFSLKSAFGGVRPGRMKKKNAKKRDDAGEDEAED